MSSRSPAPGDIRSHGGLEDVSVAKYSARVVSLSSAPAARTPSLLNRVYAGRGSGSTSCTSRMDAFSRVQKVCRICSSSGKNFVFPHGHVHMTPINLLSCGRICQLLLICRGIKRGLDPRAGRGWKLNRPHESKLPRERFSSEITLSPAGVWSSTMLRATTNRYTTTGVRRPTRFGRPTAGARDRVTPRGHRVPFFEERGDVGSRVLGAVPPAPASRTRRLFLNGWS